MILKLRLPFALALALTIWGVALTSRAQQPAAQSSTTDSAAATDAAASESPDANAAAQAKAAFEAKFNEYKAAVRDIEKLQSEYQTADAAAQQKINAQLTAQVAHAQSIVNAMVEAATEAYRFAPNADPRITEMLIAVARYYAIGNQTGPGQPSLAGDPEDIYYPIDGGDKYERALPIIKLLLENDAEESQLYVWGFLAAFATNDYDLAAQWLQKAQETGALQTMASEAGKADNESRQAGLMKTLVHQISTSIAVLDEYRQLWQAESALRAAEAKADDLPRVKLTTTKGEITIELFENQAPQSVANFITLVKQGFYDGSPFHRVLPKFMAQGGGTGEDGQGGPGYTIRCECYRPDHRRHFRGTLSMAHAGRDTGSSQFFLTVVPTPHLNGRHTAFGRVIEGTEVLTDLQRRSPQHQTTPPKADVILKAEVVRDRGHEYKFEKLPER